MFVEWSQADHMTKLSDLKKSFLRNPANWPVHDDLSGSLIWPESSSRPERPLDFPRPRLQSAWIQRKARYPAWKVRVRISVLPGVHDMPKPKAQNQIFGLTPAGRRYKSDLGESIGAVWTPNPSLTAVKPL